MGFGKKSRDITVLRYCLYHIHKIELEISSSEPFFQRIGEETCEIKR